MKTFEQIINEGQQFLRSVGKNDKVEKSFTDLKIGDYFYAVLEGDLVQKIAKKKYTYHAQRLFTNILDTLDVFGIDLPSDHEYVHEHTFVAEDSDVKATFFVDYDEFIDYINEHCETIDLRSSVLLYRQGDESVPAIKLPFYGFEKKYLKRH